MAIEILCIKLRNSIEVKGFKIYDEDFLLSLYADDCSIFLEYNALNLSNVIGVLNSFFLTSGLQIQLQKTQCAVFGKIPATDNVLCAEFGLKWDQNFKLLGIKFDGTLSNIETNYDEKIVLPSFNKQKFKLIESEVYKFIWRGKENVTKLLEIS